MMGKPFTSRRIDAYSGDEAIDKSGYTIGMNFPECEISSEFDATFRCDEIKAYKFHEYLDIWEVYALFSKPDYFTLPELAYITWVPQK